MTTGHIKHGRPQKRPALLKQKDRETQRYARWAASRGKATGSGHIILRVEQDAEESRG